MQKGVEILVMVVVGVVLVMMGTMMYVQNVRFSRFSQLINRTVVQTQNARPQEASKAVTVVQPYVEYLFSCPSGKENIEKRTGFDALLKAAGLEQTTGNSVITCVPSGSNKDLALIATSNCASGPAAAAAACDKALLVLADLKTNSLKTVATEETSEMYGSSVFERIISWKPDAVTYNLRGSFADGGDCTEAIIKQTPAYTQVVATISRQSSSVAKTCYYSSCSDVGSVTCE